MSPSRTARLLACPLRIAFEQAAPRQLEVSPSPFATVGLAVHRVIELCLTGEVLDLVHGWNRACDELEASGLNPRGAPGARRAQLRLDRRFPDLLNFVRDCEPTEIFLERDLVAPDGSFAGRLDLLILGRMPAVVDYKTGLVERNGQPDESYERQLRIYAWLADQALDVDIRVAALFSLRQGMVEVDASRAQREAAMRHATAAVTAFNRRVPGAQPASPSEVACGWCPHVGGCDSAWAALGAGDIVKFGWGDAVRGIVPEPPSRSADGHVAIQVDVEVGTVSGQATLIDIPASLVHDVVPGSRLSAWSLVRRSVEPNTLAWREQSSHLRVD